jgi:selenoprotein W-related protein
MADAAKPARKPLVTITYCTGCNWLLRAGWMAQELLQTFQTDLGGVTLVPGETGGVYEIAVDGRVIWERKRDGGFPDAKEIKSRLRDVIEPEKDLGHIDRAARGK